MTDEKLTQLESAIDEITKEIIQGLSFNRVKTEKVSEMIVLAIRHYTKAKDKRLFKKIFFQKVGKTTLFSLLHLKDYFLDYGVAFEYNAKKDMFWVAGNPADIQDTFLDWKEKEKTRKRQENEKLTDKEKLEKRFKKSFESLTKKQKEILLALLKG